MWLAASTTATTPGGLSLRPAAPPTTTTQSHGKPSTSRRSAEASQSNGAEHWAPRRDHSQARPSARFRDRPLSRIDRCEDLCPRRGGVGVAGADASHASANRGTRRSGNSAPTSRRTSRRPPAAGTGRLALTAPSGRLSVSELFACWQFADSSHFIRAFKKYYCQTLTKYARSISKISNPVRQSWCYDTHQPAAISMTMPAPAR
jgi:AraC-like DNA-binding protein